VRLAGSLRGTIGGRMRLIEQLRAEHDLIEQVAGSLRSFARQLARGEAEAADGAGFVAFFRLYAGRFHHAREEDTLFVALERDAELPGDRGPLATIREDHHRMAGLLDDLEARVGGPGEGDVAAFETVALEYTRQLWQHIDAENSVLLPESETRLRRHGVFELPSRDPSREEEEARVVGERLLLRYPPVHEPEVMRGDGCVFCPAFTSSCRGIEHEWWNEWEWEEFEDHLPSG